MDADGYPVWSPDVRFLVFQAAGGMFWIGADGAGKPQPLTRSKSFQLQVLSLQMAHGLSFVK